MDASLSKAFASFPPPDASAIERLAPALPTWALSTGTPAQVWGLSEGIVRAASENQDLVRLVAGLLCWSRQMSPLHLHTISLLRTLDGSLHFLGPAEREELAGIRKRLLPPPGREDWELLRFHGDEQARTAFIERALGSRAATAWLAELWEDVVQLPDPALAEKLVDQAAPDPACRLRLQAELALHHGRLDQAARLARDMAGTSYAAFGVYLAGHLAALEGDTRRAADILLAVWNHVPWHCNLTLKAHDLAFPPSLGPLPEESTAILVYTWNKAELARQTLDSLFASRLGGNRVFVLDNGSTDSTPDLLVAKRDHFGPDRLTIVTLPVNVGAPAARNWLLSLPEVRACRRAAFLDDDIRLPADWLEKLLTAAERHPECATVGCAIRDHLPPHKLQAADFHLLPDSPGDTPGDRVRVFSNCTDEPDLGLFDYERPCLSVSGCCHLLDLETLDAVGGFDVRFTPTQFDDLDRDMRSWLVGRPCLYTGTLKVDHVQRSSLNKATTPAAVGHVLGNKIKLDAKYDDAQLSSMAAGNLQLAWKDLLAKHRALRSLTRRR